MVTLLPDIGQKSVDSNRKIKILCI